MKNPHIIVGPGRRCICGIYGTLTIRCHEVMAILGRAKLNAPDASARSDIQKLVYVMETLTEECSPPAQDV